MSTPAVGKVSPIPTDRALLLLAMDNPGVGFALGEIHNHFQRKLDAIPVPKVKAKSPCKTCGRETGFPWNGVVWCVNTKCEDFHTVFTSEEWQARATEKLIETHRAEY